MESLNKKTLFDRVVGSIAQSTPMNKLNSFIASRIELQGPPATEEFQKMGAEAQTAVGIPTGRQVPIRDFENMSKSAATAEHEAIYLDKDTFNGTNGDSYGFLRSAIHHEAVHIKYNDDLVGRLISPKSGILGGLLLAALLKPRGSLKILYPISIIAGTVTGHWLNRKYSHYFERRADIEGHYVTQCSFCVHEKAETKRKVIDCCHNALEFIKSGKYDEKIKKEIAEGKVTTSEASENRELVITMAKNQLEDDGYLSPDELKSIALDLKQQGKVCTFHNACKAPIINV
jgi:hypothetical protein